MSYQYSDGMCSLSDHTNSSAPLRQLTDMMLDWDEFSAGPLLAIPLGLITTGFVLRCFWKKRQGNVQKVTLSEEVESSSCDFLVYASEDLPEEVESSSCDFLVYASEDLLEEVESSSCKNDASEDLPEEVESSSCKNDASEDLPEEVESFILIDASEDLPEKVDSSSRNVSIDASEDLPEEVESFILIDASEDLPEEVDSSSRNVSIDASEDLPEEVDSSSRNVSIDASEDLPEEVESFILIDASEDLPEEVDSSSRNVSIDASEDLPEEVESFILIDASEDLPEEVDSSSRNVSIDASEDLPEEVDSSSRNVSIDASEDLPEEGDSSSAQTSTSADVPSQEPTPATDALQTEPLVEIAQPSWREPKIIGSLDSLFEVGKKLAAGSYGIVHEGIRRLDGTPVIIKYVKKRRFDFHIGRSKPLCREEAIMRMLKHSDHFMRLIECLDSMEDHKILIMEHPGTSVTLCDFIKENEGRVTEADAKGIMQKLVAALQHCSEQGVYYKNLSLRNVLIDKDTMQIKLNCFYRELSIIERRRFKSIERNPALVTAKEGLYKVLKKMVGEKYFALQNTHLSKDCLDLLRKLCDKESQITLENILDHDWFNNTSGADALDNTSGADALDNTSGADALDNTSGADALDNTSGADALDNTSGTDAPDNTSGADALDNTSGADALDNTSGTDALDNTSGTDALKQVGITAGHVGMKNVKFVVCKTRSLPELSAGTRTGAESRNRSA